MKTKRIFIAIAACMVFSWSCKKDKVTYLKADLNVVAASLDTFAWLLPWEPSDPARLSVRIRTYLQQHPSYFYGATVTLLDSNRKATYSAYYYRRNGNIDSSDLMAPAYGIDSQAWLRKPIDSGYAIWTEPYYDAGGGNIWMRTRSVPVYTTAGKLFAVATTDVQVDKP